MGGARALLAEAQSSADSACTACAICRTCCTRRCSTISGLVAALESLVADFRRRHQHRRRVPAPGTRTAGCSAETERAVYRIVQEALTNIARHAEAHVGGVHLSASIRASVSVTIEDNGVGFDVADVERPGKRRGLGLLEHPRACAQAAGNGAHRERVRQGSRIEVELPAARAASS